MNLNEIEHPQRQNIEHQRAPSGSFKIEVQPVSLFPVPSALAVR